VSVRRLVPSLLAACLLLAGCGARPSGEGGFVSGDGALTRVPVAQRSDAPAIAGPTLGGGSFDASRHRGKVIVYNVWGSWCAPCRKEAPALVAASERTKEQAVFVGINTRDLDQAPAEAFVRAFGVPYANVFDPQGQLLLKFGSELPPSAIPSTIVVDPQGRVAARILGETTEATLVGLVDDVAKGE